MRLRHLAVAVALVSVLTACASPAPAVTSFPPEPTPTLSPTPEPESPIVNLLLSGTEITAQDDDGTEVSSHAFDGDISSMVAYLEPILGPATADTVDYCEYYQWGSDEQAVVLAAVGGHPTSYNFRTQARELNGVALSTSAGFSVGDDISEYVASHPPSEIDAVLYDPRPDNSSSGGMAYIEGGNRVYLVITPGVGDFGEYCS